MASTNRYAYKPLFNHLAKTTEPNEYEKLEIKNKILSKYNSISSFAESNGYTRSYITGLLNGKRKAHVRAWVRFLKVVEEAIDGDTTKAESYKETIQENIKVPHVRNHRKIQDQASSLFWEEAVYYH